MELVERFLKYVSFDTQSDPESDTTPSTEKQWAIARYLKDELESIGLKQVTIDEHGYVFATLPSNVDKKVPTIGFIAHYDTSPDCSGANVRPRIVENYQGGDIVLDAEAGIAITTKRFPEIEKHKGCDLIVTDGHTLLGADDKAGVAEIVTAMEYLLAHPEIKHGDIRVGFNPDEEIGRGAHKFDVEAFGAEWAYTMDGSEIGELEYENFNAAFATINITGVSVHPGYAKDKMVNAIRIAAETATLFPADETPETTTGFEGFYHIMSVSGNVERASVQLIIRDHDRTRFAERKRFVEQVVAEQVAKYGEEVVTLEMADQYYNMLEKIEPVMHVIDIAIKAMEQAGVSPKVKAIRGGTDGAQLSYMGLPCPNIFAGGQNFHGPYEYVPVQAMQKAVDVIVKISELTASYND